MVKQIDFYNHPMITQFVPGFTCEVLLPKGSTFESDSLEYPLNNGDYSPSSYYWATFKMPKPTPDLMHKIYVGILNDRFRV